MLSPDTVAVAQVVRAPGCGPGGRGFESPRSPSTVVRSWQPRHYDRPSGASSSTAEQRTLNPQVLGSNPRGRTQPKLLLSGMIGVGVNPALRGTRESHPAVHTAYPTRVPHSRT